MTNSDLQAETNVLSEIQSKFLDEVLEKHGFKGSKVIIAPLGKAGDNYGSTVKTITAVREDGKTLKMVAKVAPTSEFLRTSMSIETVFGNEIFMYETVLPKFRELEIEAGIPEDERFKFPICYGVYRETLNEIILLEDLRESGYGMKDRMKSLKDDDVRVIIDSFAKLHSFSFLLKSKEPATYEEFTSKLTDFFTAPQLEATSNNSFILIEDNIYALLDSGRYKDKFRGCLSNIATEARRIRKCDAGSKYSVIIHGDSWTNNILFKTNNTNGSEECMLIDYQLSCERAPVSDLLYLIFSCTDFETRSKHYDVWIDEYHEKLDKYLSRYGIKANYVYSKEKMLADIKRYSKFFLGWSTMITNVLCMDTEEAGRLKDAMNTSDNLEEIVESMKADSHDNKTQNLLKAKVQGVIDSYYELGFIN